VFVVVTCEHGGNRVPSEYRHLFHSRAARAALGSHRGVDLGALPVARALARNLGAPLIYSTVTRLLVDLNRSTHHPSLFSSFSRPLDATARRRVIARYYEPHRGRVERAVGEPIARGQTVLHVAVHSFTPRAACDMRQTDIGLLYDPRRAGERELCARWKTRLERNGPQLRVRRNYPYLGKADGLTTHLRRRFSPARYLGIELEVNQSLLAGKARRATTAVLVETLVELLSHRGS
jgi:predicted N-formylglutamate amidohydrolase